MAERAEPSHGLLPKAAAYREQPSDHTSVLAVIVQLEGTSNSSGALRGKTRECNVRIHTILDYSLQ